jgi:hypothetical protein
MQPSNPFTDRSDGSNPYAASGSVPGDVKPAQLAARALFLPAIFLLVVSVFWALYMVMALAMILSPQGLFRDEGHEFIWVSSLVSYCIIFLASLVSIAAAIAMLRMQPKWLAWTGAILALVPMFGPCMGLTIPLGIWALVILRRPEVNASFRS